ncbi:hypothetical protein FOXB_15430 [Fusarium oxysporum f. sp. conglutinans Fo5176]|uniref:Uncharacterized protein n=3 Tax=Fusarium oxysporum TaxID=5507 RepID=F9G9U8_FUSOF|nr:hypothetical protein FOXB_15430 [Fusarium oxysporum f. sp. conglutinans Fo5176]
MAEREPKRPGVHPKGSMTSSSMHSLNPIDQQDFAFPRLLPSTNKIPTSEWAYPDEIFEAAMTDIKNWDEHRYYTIQAKWIKTCTSYKPIFGFSNVVKRLKAYGRFQLSRGCAPKRLLGGKTYAWIDKPTIVKFVQPESGHEKTGHWGDNLPHKTSTHVNSYNKK